MSICKERNFNSIKVRLKLKDVVQRLLADSAFQFHKGTIKTVFKYVSLPLESNFNSIKVRLKHEHEQLMMLQKKISIP